MGTPRFGCRQRTLAYETRCQGGLTGRRSRLISAYRAAVASEPFGAVEARRFISYVRAQELPVPHLTEILDFEGALNAVGGKLEERVVTFDCNPAALLNALMKRRYPGLLTRERFYVEVSTNCIQIRR
jgi:hypothetical protein